MTRNKSKTRAFAAAAALAAAGLTFTGSAEAGVSQVSFKSGQSIEDTGVTFTGTLKYDDSANLLTIDLNNTSSFQSVITGFYFNIDGDASADYNAANDLTTPGVDESAFDNDTSLSPFGDWDAGAFLQDLSKQQVKGIDEGEAGRFTFDVSGAGADALAALDFFTETNSGGGLTGAFAVRYQSVGDNAALSDKVLGVLIDDGGPDPDPGTDPNPIPLPPAAWAGLLTMGLAGVTQLRGRIRRRHA